MKFWDREKEIDDLKRYLQSEPNAILFVYGPKSSGKSTLMIKVAQKLKEQSFSFLWYDLRKYAIEKAEDAISILLGAKGTPTVLAKLFDIQLAVVSIKTEELLKVLRKEKDPFVLMEEELLRIRESGAAPVIVFDEIQNFKDIYLNGERRLIDRLFNFFVALTKVNHLAHVLVMTLDTFFIEEIYSSSSLKNTSRYYLVDYFGDETAYEILVDEGLSDGDARYVVEWVGGVPWMMEEVVESDDVKATVEDLYTIHEGKLREFLLRYDEHERAVKVLKDLLAGEEVLSRENLGVIEDMVKSEILFYDPLGGSVRFQTKLDERAARELIK